MGASELHIGTRRTRYHDLHHKETRKKKRRSHPMAAAAVCNWWLLEHSWSSRRRVSYRPLANKGSFARFIASASWPTLFIQRSTSCLFSAWTFAFRCSATLSCKFKAMSSSWTFCPIRQLEGRARDILAAPNLPYLHKLRLPPQLLVPIFYFGGEHIALTSEASYCLGVTRSLRP